MTFVETRWVQYQVVCVKKVKYLERRSRNNQSYIIFIYFIDVCGSTCTCVDPSNSRSIKILPPFQPPLLCRVPVGWHSWSVFECLDCWSGVEWRGFIYINYLFFIFLNFFFLFVPHLNFSLIYFLQSLCLLLFCCLFIYYFMLSFCWTMPPPSS